MSEWILEAKDLWKGYRTSGEQLQVLKGLSLSVRRGEFVAIQGASGVGKSTLLHLLGGLDHPDRGSLRVTPDSTGEPAELHRMSDSALNRFRGEQVGFVFQFHHLLPEFDAMENVLLPALIRGQAFETARRRAEILLAEVGLAERMHHRPNQLSGGEAQRVAIARALVNQPQLLLMDEPTGNLDRQRGEQIFELVGSVHRERRQTIIVVTHDPDIAARTQRVLHLVGGVLMEQSAGAPAVASD